MRALACLALSAIALSACSPSGGASASNPNEDARFAGLEQQIAAWRTEIETSNVACTKGGGCQDFQVACKAEREITPAEQAKGVTAKLVAAMTFNGQGANPDDLKPGSAFAEFAKAGETWTRGEAPTVNLSTCAAY